MREVTDLAALRFQLAQPLDSLELRPRVVRVGEHLLFQAVADGAHGDAFVRHATLRIEVLLRGQVTAVREWPIQVDLSGVEPILIETFWTDALAEIGVDSDQYDEVSFRSALRPAR